MSFRILNQRSVYLNLQGQPCVGGTLSTYAAGTSTPIDTYSDIGLTVSNGPTVQLGADGRTMVDIWSTGVLRVVLSDRYGNVMSDSDNTEANSDIPTQTGEDGKFLQTNGTTMAWVAVSQVPSVTGSAGKVLTTDGTTYFWGTPSYAPTSLTNVLFCNDRETAQTINFAATGALAIDFTAGGVVVLNQSAAISSLSVTGMTAGQACFLLIRRYKDASSTAQAITFGSQFQFPGGIVPTLTQTASAHDDLSCVSHDGGTTITLTAALNIGAP
jgi:hypothetical protein